VSAAPSWEALLARARAELADRTALCDGLFGLGAADWSLDLAAGAIGFAAPGKPAARAAVQIVGTLDPVTGTWLWGWDHPSVPNALRRAAERARALGVARGLASLTMCRLAATDAEAWDWTALAALLDGAEGAYAAPGERARVFLVFAGVTLGQ
jgi:hypothetical protein